MQISTVDFPFNIFLLSFYLFLFCFAAIGLYEKTNEYSGTHSIGGNGPPRNWGNMDYAVKIYIDGDNKKLIAY